MRPFLIAVVAAALATAPAQAQGRLPGTLVIVTGEHATVPVPTLLEGPANTSGNQDVADLLFLRLALAGQGRSTADERGFVPQLARRWTRRDSLTIAFDLDPRARWHDGRPVTARDVTFAFERAMDPAIAPSLADQLTNVASVRADGATRVIVTFHRAYPEQLFDATRYVQPLPAHLLAGMPAGAVATSDFVRAPVGNGAYRWSRSVTGEFLELVAVPQFFLGRPGIGRIVFRTATDPAARLNLLLSGEGDALEHAIPPLSNRDRLLAQGDFRLVTTPSNSVGYVLFNQRAPGDSTRPHPILGDARVRRALVRALDRRTMLLSTMGPYAQIPFGPVSTALWISEMMPPAEGEDMAEARALLAQAGWRDSDGDGVLDRGGVPFRVGIDVPSTSGIRRRLAELAQERYRQLGVQLDVSVLERGVWMERYTGGRFDLSFGSAAQEPSPSALRQSWGCGGSSNVSGYCNPRLDSLMRAATLAPRPDPKLWRNALDVLEADAPAAFMYAPWDVVVLHARFDNVQLRSDSPWMTAWQWRVPSRAQLPRDRASR